MGIPRPVLRGGGSVNNPETQKIQTLAQWSASAATLAWRPWGRLVGTQFGSVWGQRGVLECWLDQCGTFQFCRDCVRLSFPRVGEGGGGAGGRTVLLGDGVLLLCRGSKWYVGNAREGGGLGRESVLVGVPSAWEWHF